MRAGGRRVFLSFIKSESFGGILLFVSAALALFVANSSFSDSYFSFFHVNFGFQFGDKFLGFSVHDWINDVLMALFFLMVGLEIKREILVGELNSVQKAAFPAVAAVGGMVIPGIIYLTLNFGTDSQHGFGIPMATDIAFVLGVILTLGKMVPLALKVFLVTLAVVDDLGAILVIAVFYTSELNYFWLFVTLSIVAVLLALNKLGVKSIPVYLLFGVLMWFSVHFSNIHATVASVVLAFCVPMKPKNDLKHVRKNIQDIISEKFLSGGHNVLSRVAQEKLATQIIEKSSSVRSPLLKMEHSLQPICGYVVMPLFAFANAGVGIGANVDLGIDHIFWGIFAGLVLGKPLGVLVTTLVCEKMGLIRKPSSVSWLHIAGGGMLAGIGFTMSLFVSNLAFSSSMSRDVAKLAVLIASVTSGIVGALFLAVCSRKSS